MSAITSSWPDAIVECQAVTGQTPRWMPAYVEPCPEGSTCSMVDGLPLCL